MVLQEKLCCLLPSFARVIHGVQRRGELRDKDRRALKVRALCLCLSVGLLSPPFTFFSLSASVCLRGGGWGGGGGVGGGRRGVFKRNAVTHFYNLFCLSVCLSACLCLSVSVFVSLSESLCLCLSLSLSLRPLSSSVKLGQLHFI